MRKYLFIGLAFVAILASCTKENFAKESLKNVNENTSLTESSTGGSGGGSNQPALTLVKSNFPNTSYYGGVTNQKVGEYLITNSFGQSVILDSVQIYFVSTSSTDLLPQGSIKNLNIREGALQLGSTIANPSVVTSNKITCDNRTLQPQESLVLSVNSDLQNPSYVFFTKMKVFGKRLTGQATQLVSTTIEIGQTITVIPEPNIVPTFVPELSTVSQYVACGIFGNENGSKAVFNFPSRPFPYKIIELKYSTQVNTGAGLIRVGLPGAPFVAGTAWLNGLNILVPANSTGINVEGVISYYDIGINGGPSGLQPKVSLAYVKYINLLTNEVKENNFNVPAVPMTLVGSKVTPVIRDSPTSGIIDGYEVLVYRTTLNVDSRGSVIQNQMMFDCVIDGGFALVNPRLAHGLATVSGSSCSISYIGNSTYRIIATYPPGFVLPANTARFFSLWAEVSGSVPATPRINTFLVPSGFIWTDQAGAGINGAESGVLIYDFPRAPFIVTQ